MRIKDKQVRDFYGKFNLRDSFSSMHKSRVFRSRLEICCSERFHSEVHRIALEREQTLSGLFRQLAVENLPLNLNQ